ncbi:MAG: glutamate--tRNA ligase [Candidatus Terrybacteria bacterium RIFCSPHIGHO2_01_FULL_48_17]|uniref:Glutamate--tRNA ligase n=1 Tax=Candidatus Terrybacteria bacterium RIFCSPHIGHO2_01_FULL_48_17 TaxID=1802362 RepID=A0A1G2PIR1_9BACT|nr:MAG: glutamate--tRNA ligase [Candidatus Terrybacteria bacterium RIFCSPHIGHO2_01_FULL_48_17]OHA53868.1 MAG: glutamate--tRNA ligase [Candidatus Terrybacteria bacterium RIFCSPLOWO2_01_FULL_48_14]
MIPHLTQPQKIFIPPPILPGKIRVRIAPSPTGALHLGTARSALFNYLFAKKYQGVFILRIEDTDVERSDPKFEKDIVEGLQWLGLGWDEGVRIGGEYAPYRQSERIYIYTKYLDRLLKEEKAYWCFCTPNELAKERLKQKKAGLAIRYSRKCAVLSSAEIKKHRSEGKSSILRLRIPDKETTFYDLIRGPITFHTNLLGDIAIAKNISTPLYNFAAVIDDYEMAITHILRGEDHIANTPKQIAIAEALEIQSPQFGHFPLILGKDRTKLSKRHGAASVQDLRNLGYLPEAVINFLALLGWNPKDNREIFSLDELIEAFSLEGIQHGGAIWGQEKLDWFNTQFMRHSEKRWLNDRKSLPNELIEYMTSLVKKAVVKEDPTFIRKRCSDIVYLVLERLPLSNLEKDFMSEFGFFFGLPQIKSELLFWKNMNVADIRQALKDIFIILEKIPAEEWEIKIIRKMIFHHAEKTNDRGRILWPLRIALSGQQKSPGPHEIASILGKEETLTRIKKAITVLKENGKNEKPMR